MKQTKEKCYVYLYRMGGDPIYVGIGTEDNGAFVRALDLRGHAHANIRASEYDRIGVEVVARNLPRGSARKLETALMRTLSQNHALRNGMASHAATDIQLIKVGLDADSAQAVERAVQDALEHGAATAVKECLEFLNGEHGPAVHNIFLEPAVDDAASLVARMSPDYDPEADSLADQVFDHIRSIGFNAAVDKLCVVVPTEAHAETVRAVTADIKFGATDRRAVLSVSLESWIRITMQNPALRRALKS